MKNLSILAIFTLLPLLTFAQFNVSFIGNLDYDQRINDIWGYEAPDGVEYALVGTNTGFSIVSLANPANPEELFFIPGDETTWRDIKTWETFAYVVCDNCSDGLLVVDLSDLPNSIESKFVTDIDNNIFRDAHNIFIDEFGYAYLAGTNLSNIFFMDCFTDPYNPAFVAHAPVVYSHDVYARGNLMYSSEIRDGQFAIYDVTDKNEIIPLATARTPFEFTHNAWLSDDSNYLFTTDERPNAPIASYDVSDPDNIVELDQFISLASRGLGTIPHNVHVFNDYLIASYYTDGCVIIDGSRPENMIEVGNFDTFIPASFGSSGSWGAYPFLPSGRILVTDRDNGLFVLEPDYKRAAFLEGNITDAQTGEALEDATINIVAYERTEVSNSFGDYKTGIPDNGIFEIEISKPFYETQTIEVELEQTVVTTLDVALVPLESFDLAIQVVEKESGDPIPFANIRLVSESNDIIAATDDLGQFFISDFIPEPTDIFAGLWGYKGGYAGNALSADDSPLIIELEMGYEDNFALDLGWETGGAFATGGWELVTPRLYELPVTVGTAEVIPGEDTVEDPGNFAYLTDQEDVDQLGHVAGEVELRSPIMEMSTWSAPTISFYYWFFDYNESILNGDLSFGDGLFEIFVSNGIEEVKMDEQTIDIINYNDWLQLEYSLADFIDITDEMQIMFKVSSLSFMDITESGVDFFQAWDANATSVSDFEFSSNIKVYPNPVSNELNLIFDDIPAITKYEISNILGMKTLEGFVNSNNKTINVQNLQTGTYIIRLNDDNGNDLGSKKFIKE